MGLGIVFDDDVTKANILDITINLHNNSYFPYYKPSTNFKYISQFSNHSRAITKNLIKNISFRLSKLSANVDIFNKAKFYNYAFLKVSYTDKVTYLNSIQSYSTFSNGDMKSSSKDINDINFNLYANTEQSKVLL